MRQDRPLLWLPNAERIMPVLVVFAEVLWLYPCVVWISGWDILGLEEPPLTLVGALMIAIGAERLPRLFLALGGPLERARVTSLFGVVLLLALVVRLDSGGGYILWDTGWREYAQDNVVLIVGGLALGAVLAYRGLSMGVELPSFSSLYRRFVVGAVSLLVLMVTWSVTAHAEGFSSIPASTGVYLASYFFMGLLVLALSHLRTFKETMAEHQESTSFLNRWSLSLLLGVLGLIVAASLGIASIFSFDLAALMLSPFKALAEWILIGFTYAVILPLALAVGGVLWIINQLRGSGDEFDPPDLSPLQDPETIEDPTADLLPGAEMVESGGIPPELVLALKWGLFAIVAIVVFFFLARALARYRKGRSDDEVEEVSESLLSWSVFGADLRIFLSGLFDRFRKRADEAVASVSPPLSVTDIEDDVESQFTTREIYQGMLWEARLSGLPRLHPETPYEYQGKLERHLADDVELHAITQAYVDERYGGVQTDSQRLRLLNMMWRRLRSMLRGLRDPPEP